MMMRLFIEAIDDNSALAAQLPVDAMVTRQIPSEDQRTWYLVQLARRVTFREKPCDRLLIRPESAEKAFSLGRPMLVRALAVGDQSPVADGFGETNFAALGMVQARKVLFHLSRATQFKVCVVLVALVLGGGAAAWWYTDDPRLLMKVAVRLFFEVLFNLK